MSFKDDISEAKSKELNYFHKANEDFADDIIESNTNCWSCQTDIPMGKKYCEMHCGHPADEFDSFTGQCKSCGKSLNVNMMMVMPSSEASATTLTDNWYNIGNGLAQCKHCTFKSGSWTEFAEHFKEAHGIGEDEDSDFVIIESLASEGRTMEQVWNQASPSQRESIMYEGGIEYEEAGQLYFGDDGSDSDTIMGYTSGMNHGQSRWDAQNDSSMDALSNTSYDQLPSNIKSRVDSGIVSYGLDLEGESKATERLSYKDAWDNLDTFKREGILMNGSGGNYEYEEDELIYVNHSYDQLPQHITQLVNEYMDYKGHTLEFNDLSEDDKEFLRKQYPDKYGSESKASEVNGDYIVNGIVVGKVTDFEPNNWFGKVELSSMPEFAEYGDLDPQAVVKGDDGVTYKSPRSGHGTSFDNDGNPIVDVTSYESKASEFEMKDFKENEYYNNHSENALELAKIYGTSEEISDMERIVRDHAGVGFNFGNEQDMEDYNRRHEIQSKYWNTFHRSEWDQGRMYHESKASEDYFEDEDGNISSVLKWKLVYEDGSDYGFQTDNKAEAQRAVDQWNETNADKPIKITSNEGFIKDMNLNKDSLRNYDLNSLINMWKDAQAYYQNPDNTWEDEDAEFYDELAVVINEKKSSAGESEDVFMYDGTGDSDGVGYWWDFELPVDQMKHEQLSSILGIDINTAWGFMTPAEQDRIRNYKLNKSMTNEAQLMKEINDGWEFSVIDHGYGGGNMGNSPDVGLLEVGIFAPDTGDINGQKSAIQGYMTQADVDGLLSTFRTDPAVAFRSIGGEWTFAGQKGLEYQSHYSDMSDITWRDIETMEGSMTLLERNMWLENRFDEITPEDFRRLADTAREE